MFSPANPAGSNSSLFVATILVSLGNLRLVRRERAASSPLDDSVRLGLRCLVAAPLQGLVAMLLVPGSW